MERGSPAARAEALAGRYEELLAQAGAAAVRWRWATASSGRGDVEPLRLERMGCSPGRWLDGPPAPGREHDAIGFDALGRVVCIRTYDATGAAWLERFAAWEPGAVEVACFRAPLAWGDAALQAVTVVRFADGRPVESERYLPPTGLLTGERYLHEDGRLVRVEEPGGVVKEVLYDDDGTVAGIDRLDAGGRHPVWRREAAATPVPA
jgi:YD repeat-containing protein